jgi:single-strand DNA-binding protein
MTVNKVILVGRVGQDPEIRYTSSGDPVINLSLATSETWKNKAGEKQEATEWHRVNFFGKPAEIINQYVRKGSQLYVEGKIKSKKYTDKQGIERSAFEIQCDLFKLIGNKPDDAPKQIAKQESQFDDMNDPIPF